MIRIGYSRGRPESEENRCARNSAALRAMVVDDDVPRPDARQISRSQAGTDEPVRFREAPGPKEVEDEVDSGVRRADRRTPRHAERVGDFQDASVGQGHRSTERIDGEGRKVACARPTGEVARRRTWGWWRGVLDAHRRRERLNDFVARAVSRPDFERVDGIGKIEGVV